MSKQLKGSSYEEFTRENIKEEYDNVWLWRDTPEYILYEANIIKDYKTFSKYRYDIGADIVAKRGEDIYFIQCKNYEGTILMNDLAGFYYLIAEYKIRGILYYNGNLSKRVEELSSGNVKYINLPFNNQKLEIETNENIIIPREYQIDAYNKLYQLTRGVLSLPCGMGKTYVASKIGENYENIIVISPLRMLAKQLLNDITINTEKKYNPLLISTDGKRKIEEINMIIKEKNIISSTYDSVDVINKIINKLKNVIIIIDEYHNLSEKNVKNKEDEINKLLKSNNKILFLSATPKWMENEEIFGYVKYNYSWIDAINKKYISDFDIIIPSNESKLEEFKELIENINLENINNKLILKCFFLLKGLLFNGHKKCITYLTTIKKAEEFKNILEWQSKMFNVEIKTYMINCETCNENRKNIINNFKTDVCISIICNVHILDEGIDIACCDSVYITQPNNNILNLIQRMSRCNRIDKNNKNKKGGIYIWSREEKIEKIMNYLNENSGGELLNKVVRLNIETKKKEKVKIELNTKIINNIKDINDELCEYLKENKCKIPLEAIRNYYDNENMIIIDKNNNLWFMAKQICTLLNYTNSKKAIRDNVDNEDKTEYNKINIERIYLLKSKNIQKHTIFINEFGFYSLLLKSKMDKATELKKWLR